MNIRNMLGLACAAGVALLTTGPALAVDAIFFSEDFNGYNGGDQNAFQYESGLKVSHSGNLPLWTKVGGGAVHAVDKDGAGDYAPMIWQDNVITLASGIAANDLGVTYYVNFSAGPAVYASTHDFQATADTDGMVIDVLRADDTVLASYTNYPGAWAGAQTFAPASFQYVGDGSGLLRLRVGPLEAQGRFGGAIDNLTVAPPAAIVSFGTNVAWSSAVIGTDTIVWNVPYGTVLATLAPEFTLSSGTCNRTSGAVPSPNFGAGPVTYTVTDTSTDPDTVNIYTVTVAVDSLIRPIAATAQSYFALDDRAPVHAIDGSGMTPNRPLTVSSTCGITPGGNMWLSDGTTETWITFDLGSVQTISGFHLWNYNENGSPGEFGRGVQTADIYIGDWLLGDGEPYADAGDAWGTLVEEMTFTMAPGTGAYAGEDYLFTTPVTTRYLQIYVISNFGFDSYTGISEIRFVSSAPSPSPPTNVQATGGPAKVDLTWSAPATGPAPTGYQVFRGAAKIADAPATPTSYTDSDAALVPGTEYCYTVKSVAGAKTSDPSNQSCGTPTAAGVGLFIRGDCNGDGQVTGQVTDAVFLLNYNFLGGAVPPCSAACDINGDGQWMGQVTDAVYILNYNFLGGTAPPAPFPKCGTSTLATDITLGCVTPTTPNCPP